TDDQVANGTADLSIEGGQLKVSISAHGLTPNSLHAAHIHGGSCSSEGSVVHPLPDLKADGGGNVSTTATIPGVTTIPGSGWYVNIHRTAVIGAQTGFDPILCGDVKS
ncbi:MAG TPA: CHRD domain-containing protein, partial [Candidatus Sulfotelmatobacter sp.]|nr:CHRD domain-containing protein [Candidatus Sulfotelmatobacter sp.]